MLYFAYYFLRFDCVPKTFVDSGEKVDAVFLLELPATRKKRVKIIKNARIGSII